jgi:hypothetical protein
VQIPAESRAATSGVPLTLKKAALFTHHFESLSFEPVNLALEFIPDNRLNIPAGKRDSLSFGVVPKYHDS